MRGSDRGASERSPGQWQWCGAGHQPCRSSARRRPPRASSAQRPADVRRSWPIRIGEIMRAERRATAVSISVLTEALSVKQPGEDLTPPEPSSSLGGSTRRSPWGTCPGVTEPPPTATRTQDIKGARVLRWSWVPPTGARLKGHWRINGGLGFSWRLLIL